MGLESHCLTSASCGTAGTGINLLFIYKKYKYLEELKCLLNTMENTCKKVDMVNGSETHVRKNQIN